MLSTNYARMGVTFMNLFHWRSTRLSYPIVVISLLIAGCSSFSKQKELEATAKDWSLTIRASQIIPVYPLTEDLQPGDIFLVQLPIDRQQELYNQRGFLPLENHIWRLQLDSYASFYENSFLVGQQSAVLPHDWQVSKADAPSWSLAPVASFPSYSFSVQRGGGFNVALPVQGVPIGLSLMGGDAAQGTIVIAEARTLGVDTIRLSEAVDTWARLHRDFLLNYAPHDKSKNYLRVVSRVYLTGRVNISLSSNRSGSAGLSAGASKPVDLVMPSGDPDVQKRNLENYKANIDSLNSMLNEGLQKVKIDGVDQLLPGATVKVVAASGNAVSLTETFSRPLVVGYLGFDVEIGPDGMLGPPIPTHAILNKEATFPPITGVASAGLARIYRSLSTAAPYAAKYPKAGPLAKDLDTTATRILPAELPCDVYGTTTPGPDAPLSVVDPTGKRIDIANVKPFVALTSYRDQLSLSISKIRALSPNQLDDQKKKAVICEETALADLNGALAARATLINQARNYAQLIEFGE